MRFDIDYSQAKTMATRLQQYLADSPKKLSRSSSIEAVAQILGFNNRNEMAARIDDDAPESEQRNSIAAYEQVINEVASWRNGTYMTGVECYNGIRYRLTQLREAASEAQDTHAVHSTLEAYENDRDVAWSALNDLRIQEIRTTAEEMFKQIQKHAPDLPFVQALMFELPGDHEYILQKVENRIIQNLLMDPQRRALLSAIFCEDVEMESAEQEGITDLPSKLARTLVNNATDNARELWENAQE